MGIGSWWWMTQGQADGVAQTLQPVTLSASATVAQLPYRQTAAHRLRGDAYWTAAEDDDALTHPAGAAPAAGFRAFWALHANAIVRVA